jgi:hypothetical protein
LSCSTGSPVISVFNARLNAFFRAAVETHDGESTHNHAPRPVDTRLHVTPLSGVAMTRASGPGAPTNPQPMQVRCGVMPRLQPPTAPPPRCRARPVRR